MNKLLIGVAFSALAAMPAFAETLEEKRREQLLYQESQRMEQPAGQDEGKMAGSEGAIGETKANSGPGVQGPPDTRTGPSTHAPADSNANADPNASDSSSGASSGEAGNETQPSQDSSGVQGFPDTRTGPSTHKPDDSMKKDAQ